MKKTVAFDFDGVVARYDGFKGEEIAEQPIEDVVRAMQMLKEKGFNILIHSTRGDEFLKDYCERFDIPFDYINKRPDKQGKNPGKPIAYVYVDDRAICYKGQTATELVSEIENFKAYWE